MKLIVGLGNPGARYARNRHNLGFMAVDGLAQCYCLDTWRHKYGGALVDGVVDGQRALLLKPMTYMNLSGQSVSEAVRFYKIAPECVIVVHDEIDIAPGSVRVKKGGGNAGHNGLKSIDAHIGNGYWRIRMGIGRPLHGQMTVSDWVLSDARGSELQRCNQLVDAVARHIPLMLADEVPAFVERVTQELSATTPS